MDVARREEIIRIARQISSQSLQLKGLIDNIVGRSSVSTFERSAQHAASQGQPQMTRRSSSRIQFGRDGEDVIRVESQILTESSGSYETIKIPTTTQISRRLTPGPPPPPPDKEPDHPRPYEDDPIWGVWENNMLRLIQLLKMLLLELKNVSDYTQLDMPAELSATESLLAKKFAASRIIGGFQNREQVSQAMNNPPPFPQLYPQPKPPKPAEERPGEIDLGAYFKKLAVQMDALTDSLKPNPSPPHAGAPTQARLIPLEEQVGRLAHNLAGVSKAIARPVEDVNVSMATAQGGMGQTAATQSQLVFQVRPQLQPQLQPELQPQLQAQLQAQLQSQLPPHLQAQLAQNRNNVSFMLDRSDSSSMLGRHVPGYTGSSRLRDNARCLIDYMKLVSDELRDAVGGKPPPPRMSIAEEEEIRDVVKSLCRNMNRMSKDMRRVVEEHTTVAGSRLVDGSDEPVPRRRRRRRR